MKLRLLAVLLVALAMSAFATPAHAADQLALSWDGRTWTDSLKGALFSPVKRWVPSDEVTASFHVRNRTLQRATLAVSVVTNDSDRLLGDDHLTLDARVGNGRWVALAQVGTLYELAVKPVAGQRSVKVDVRARFLDASGNESQRDQLPFRIHVVLADAGLDGVLGEEADGGGAAGNGSGVFDGSDESDRGWLPDTGAPRLGLLFLISATLLGVGIALIRRRDEDEDEQGMTHG